MKEEICEECIGIIGLADQAHVYKGRIVCERCDKKLRQGARQALEFPDAEETWKDQQLTDAEDTWVNQEVEEPFESMEKQKPGEHEELKEPKEPQESGELLESVETQEAKESVEFQEPQESKEAREILNREELFESLERQELEKLEELKEPKEPKESQEGEEPFESLEAQEPKEFEEFQKAEELQKQKEPQDEEGGEPFESLEDQEMEEFEDFQEPQESEELLEKIAGPVEAEQAAEVPEVETAKPLPCKRRRVSRTESTVLPLLLVAWSFLCLLLLFYVPGRYAETLKNSTIGDELQLGGFAVDCLILFFMVLWFFGALGLYAVIIGYDREDKYSEKLRILRLLGF